MNQYRHTAVVGIVFTVWIGLVAFDWVMRFTWFQWQQNILSFRLLPERGSFPPLGVFTNPPVRGGDLTTLLGPGRSADKYKEWKPAATNWSDEYGFRNVPPTADRYYPIVTVGDSFMLAGPRMEDTFAGVLERELGMPVYNYAVDGRGPIWPVLRFLNSTRFSEKPPRVLIWGVLERDLRALVYDETLEADLNSARRRWPFRPHAMTPASLKRTLPDTAATAQIAQRVWKVLRRLVGLAPQADVIEAPGLGMLFYRPGLTSVLHPLDTASVARVAMTVKAVDTVCRQRGLHLLVVLIPDKEQVYREMLPLSANARRNDQPYESALLPLEEGLRERGVEVINLLPLFRQVAAHHDRLLYWRDDTHWNPNGVNLAASAVVNALQARLVELPDAL